MVNNSISVFSSNSKFSDQSGDVLFQVANLQLVLQQTKETARLGDATAGSETAATTSQSGETAAESGKSAQANTKHTTATLHGAFCISSNVNVQVETAAVSLERADVG